jgi:hypothetical protein
MVRLSLIIAAAVLALVAATPSEALPKRSGTGTINDCLGADTDKECDEDGIICYCCYADGCWICGFDEDGNAYQDCVWEGSLRPSLLLKRLLQRMPAGSLQTLEPVSPPKPRLPVVRTPGTLAPSP